MFSLTCIGFISAYHAITFNGQLKIDYNHIFNLQLHVLSFFYEQDIAKIFVYKHCFFRYLNVENVKQKDALFYQAMVLWLAY